MNATNEEEINVIRIIRKLRRTINVLSELQLNENSPLIHETTSLIDEADVLFEELYSDFTRQQRNLNAIKILVNKVIKGGTK